MDIIHLTERNQASAVEKTVSVLKRGGVVAIPTDTVYGLAADTARESAVRKVFRIKSRSHTKALPIFVRDIEMARHFSYIELKLVKLLEELWPGPTTVVLRKRDRLADYVTGGEKTVGMRIPDYSFTQDVLGVFPNPITGTSANISGTESAHSAIEVQNTFKNAVARPDLIIDAGELPPSEPSTVLDLVRPENPKILRMGATSREQLIELLSHWEKPRV